MSVRTVSHKPGDDLRDFIRAGHVVYENDANWVPHLHFELNERFNPSKNPFLKRADVAMFTAWRGKHLVGRCTAQIDREHLREWKDDTGFFGFFDTIDDDEVAQSLTDAACDWLRARGMKRVSGPFSLYVNEEVGVLVEGFDTPPVMMMAHSRPYQARLAEACGFTKEKDLFAWRYERGKFPDRVIKAWEATKALPEVRLRSVDLKRIHEEIQNVMEIYNDAWHGKWGFVAALPEEVKKVATELRMIMDPDLAFIAEIDGRAVGMCIMLPNLNEAIRDLDGRLLPTGFAKLLWRMKVKHPVSTRLMMLGIRSELRRVKRYGGLSAAMYVEVAKRGIEKGYQWGELSWTREDDTPINLGIRSMGAKLYKRYRVFQKSLAE